MMLFVIMGESALFFNCLGISSLSKILEVFTSNCLVLSDVNRTDCSNLGLQIQLEEYIFGTSLTISCSHSSAIVAVALSSPAFTSNCGVPSAFATSIAEFDSAITSKESGSVKFSSELTSSNLGGIDLGYSFYTEKIRKIFN